MTSPIFITGVGKRVGLALSRDLLSKGVPVVGTYRSHHRAIDELKELGAELYCCDFYSQEALAKLIRSVQNRFPALRGIIHNASDWLPDNAELAPAEILQRMMQIHVSTPYQINLALKECLLACSAETKDIIHITDYVAEKGSKKHIAYAASKAALANLTLSFSAAFAPQIKVNSIAPALVKFQPVDSEDYKARTLKKSLMQREGGYQEVIDTVNYLLNSRYVTGRTLYLDGGRHLV